MDKTLDQRNKCWLEIERQDKQIAEMGKLISYLADKLIDAEVILPPEIWDGIYKYKKGD